MVTQVLKGLKIGIVGLGYVGLPLAVAFAGKYKVFGFDSNAERIAELKMWYDHTLEIEGEVLMKIITNDCSTLTGLFCTNELEMLRKCNVYIVTVPTPVDKNNRPDMTPLLKASKTIGRVLKKNDTVIYESTVYPGATEEECVPVLEKVSGLKFNTDFFVGYSPERINPGDKEHTVTHILKITSGSTPAAADMINDLYGSVILAGTYKASSIKVAEAAKVIENAQRDINIAFVNELAMIFNKLGIDTGEVLKAAGTKWNFMKFQPGLVGGHCIGVDPYYLAQKAQEQGYYPEIILAGRRINDRMGIYIADELVKRIVASRKMVDCKVLILGFTFKENCPDVRNTKVIDIVRRLREYNIQVVIHDPWADPAQVEREYGVICQNGESKTRKYDAIILAVAHRKFKDIDISAMCNAQTIVYDLKSLLPDKLVNMRL
ncbi:UDP-N-acetyl-D-galactosamine dehydrogenase [Pedobacter steynii]|uniref:UDP-N-acetyl-D-galactosamine dehydrogenase n=1 Tax=Pedobacter steynii TaxID=430522 RepID=A0A1G9REG1_9SPHI|nr:nucleotide sugar dehydrogenase [Pedobacter steynii]NQX37786.1 nucleotide sugar dehydrogenase [Pedobacter steynii]SDM21450.1 UDP-N-acetyl-D-galactosamine dehydrogenase [Pedobacter steynii]